MNLIIIWNNGDKYKEKDVPQEKLKEFMNTVREKGFRGTSWGNPNSMLLNLEFARQVYVEE